MKGSEHLAIGYDASKSTPTMLTSGTMAIGAHATIGLNLSRASAIGFRSIVECSDCMILGSIKGKNGATAYTEVGIGTDFVEHPLHVYGNSSAGNPQILLEEATDLAARIEFHDLVTDDSWEILGDPDPNLFTSQMAFHYNGPEKCRLGVMVRHLFRATSLKIPTSA
ncbi:MAG: hypothetical protein IPN29_17440 [Saprospiraceae bacterium]|nr:hypothetical protein [Saprospiraceae bacterium]